MKNIYFLIGMPGSGKTSWRKKNNLVPNVVSIDSYFKFLTATKNMSMKFLYYSINYEDMIYKKIEMANKFIKHNLDLIIDDWNLSIEHRKLITIPEHYTKHAIVFNIHNINYNEWQRRFSSSMYNFLSDEEQFNLLAEFEIPIADECFNTIQMVA